MVANPSRIEQGVVYGGLRTHDHHMHFRVRYASQENAITRHVKEVSKQRMTSLHHHTE